MNEEHRNALQASLNGICRDLNAEDILPTLIAIGVVHDGQAQEIMTIPHKPTRNMQLIKIVTAAGPSAFQEFMNALDILNKSNLADNILPDLSSLFDQQLTVSEMNITEHSSNQAESNTFTTSSASTSNIQDSQMQDGSRSNQVAYGNIYSGGASGQHHAFNNQNNQGKTVGGSIHGGQVFLGDNITLNYTGQSPPTSSSIPSQLGVDDWQQKLLTTQQSLKAMYLTRFQKVYPFSLPFTFDIENTWVSLALKEDYKHSQPTEDHAKLLKTAFDKAKLLITEGDPATGKTSLMRRLAYEWAKGAQEMQCYDLVLYAEFRKVRETTFASIVELVLFYSKTVLKKESYKKFEKLMNSEQFCEERRILILLDGYDESSLERQCLELRTYLFDNMIGKELLYNIVITTRKGYLSNLKGREGRYIFAEVLGFTTNQQKEKYIDNHFHSKEIDNKEKIAVVNSLLTKNENLNKLAETPLFLTFICLVHERIVDGTLLELYYNTIWWLIDRYQQAFPDRDIPSDFGFQNDSSDKFEIIQDNFLHFPQICCLGKMALRKLQENEFKSSDCTQFELQPIIEQVGLLRKEKIHDNSFKLVTSFFFPHRTIQEFLAAFFCLCSNDDASEWLLSSSKLDTSKMNEFERFLLRIALSNKMPIQTDKRKYYFERITDIELDITFDAFNTTAGLNKKLLNWFISQSAHVQSIILNGEKDDKIRGSTYSIKYNEGTFEGDFELSFKNCPSMKDLKIGEFKLKSNANLNVVILPTTDTVEFWGCSFEANSELSFTKCRALKNLKFNKCVIARGANIGFSTSSAIDTLELHECKIDLATWQSLTDAIRKSSIKCLKPTFGKYAFKNKVLMDNDFKKELLIHLQECKNIEKIEITILNYTIRQNDLFLVSNVIKLHSLTFGGVHSDSACKFLANSQLSFTNCPSLKNLTFNRCEMNSTNLGIATLPAIDTVTFWRCNIDLATWKSITDQISNSSVKYLQFSSDFFMEETYPEILQHLQICERIEEIHVTDDKDSNEDECILHRYEEELTENLLQTAYKLPGLTSIVFDAKKRRLKESNQKQIKEAGQKRNPDFSIKYVNGVNPELEE